MENNGEQMQCGAKILPDKNLYSEEVEGSCALERFNKSYEMLFKEFQETLVSEYFKSREDYIKDYELNFVQSSTRRVARITETNYSIDSHSESINELNREL